MQSPTAAPSARGDGILGGLARRGASTATDDSRRTRRRRVLVVARLPVTRRTPRGWRPFGDGERRAAVVAARHGTTALVVWRWQSDRGRRAADARCAGVLDAPQRVVRVARAAGTCRRRARSTTTDVALTSGTAATRHDLVGLAGGLEVADEHGLQVGHRLARQAVAGREGRRRRRPRRRRRRGRRRRARRGGGS